VNAAGALEDRVKTTLSPFLLCKDEVTVLCRERGPASFPCQRMLPIKLYARSSFHTKVLVMATSSPLSLSLPPLSRWGAVQVEQQALGLNLILH
jgi:hypothetical protein